MQQVQQSNIEVNPFETVWMPHPQSFRACPPGLEWLDNLDQVRIHERLHTLALGLFKEMRPRFSVKKSFDVKNMRDQLCYIALQEPTVMQGSGDRNEPFVMHFMNKYQQEVMRVTRPYQTCGGFCGCSWFNSCLYSVDVEVPVGHLIGTVKQLKSWCYPQYSVHDAAGHEVLAIKGPQNFCIGPTVFQDQLFDIVTIGHRQRSVGSITMHYSGNASEAFKELYVKFPNNLDVTMRAVLVAAAFLINMMFFDYNPSRPRH